MDNGGKSQYGYQNLPSVSVQQQNICFCCLVSSTSPVCLLVCFICQQGYPESTEPICTKSSGGWAREKTHSILGGRSVSLTLNLIFFSSLNSGVCCLTLALAEVWVSERASSSHYRIVCQWFFSVNPKHWQGAFCCKVSTFSFSLFKYILLMILWFMSAFQYFHPIRLLRLENVWTL